MIQPRINVQGMPGVSGSEVRVMTVMATRHSGLYMTALVNTTTHVVAVTVLLRGDAAGLELLMCGSGRPGISS